MTFCIIQHWNGALFDTIRTVSLQEEMRDNHDFLDISTTSDRISLHNSNMRIRHDRISHIAVLAALA